MTDELRTALEHRSLRGQRRGAEVVLREATLLAGAQRPSHRVAKAIIGVAAASTAVAGASYAYLAHKADQVPTLALRATLDETDGALREPTTFLVVGTDRRPDLAGRRADTIMVVHFDPVHRRAAVVSIPRDLWVPVDQTGAPQRISTALDGGAESLITTVKALLHIPINHYVEIDFDGFRRIIDAMGGVDIDFAAPTRDVLTGLEVEEAGCVHLDGDEALSLARSRHLQQLTGGRWEVDPTGDLGRITRQQALVLALFADLAATKNPATINRILDAAVDGVTMDDSLDASDLRDLGAEIRSLEPSDIALITLPTAAASIGGAAVLTADAASISGTVDQLLGRSQATLEPTSATPAAISGSC